MNEGDEIHTSRNTKAEAIDELGLPPRNRGLVYVAGVVGVVGGVLRACSTSARSKGRAGRRHQSGARRCAGCATRCRDLSRRRAGLKPAEPAVGEKLADNTAPTRRSRRSPRPSRPTPPRLRTPAAGRGAAPGDPACDLPRVSAALDRLSDRVQRRTHARGDDRLHSRGASQPRLTQSHCVARARRVQPQPPQGSAFLGGEGDQARSEDRRRVRRSSAVFSRMRAATPTRSRLIEKYLELGAQGAVRGGSARDRRLL